MRKPPGRPEEGALMPSPLPCPRVHTIPWCRLGKTWQDRGGGRVHTIPWCRLGKTWQHGRAVPSLPGPRCNPTCPITIRSPRESVASGTSGETSRVAEGELPSIYEEIEALGLTPVTQGEDDPLLAGLDLSNLTLAPPVPCPLPLTATFAPTSEGSQGCSICPAVGGTLLLAAESTEAIAGALRLGPELHGLPLKGVGRLTSFPGGDPTDGAVTTMPAVVPEPSIMEGPLPHPHLPEPDRERPSSNGLAPGAQDPTFAPLPGSAPNPCLALPLDPCPAPDVNPAPVPPPPVLSLPPLGPSSPRS
ncbi:hypothetical protein UY3_09715 [Chelonia mydas]|uniref:Uncharacterized protein n=1 Tax=Chelonia mydas TaxID=8469 RepID=M7BM98_CHEMY|nr:hypothetical protein UY3_09715 [Chelonia mydas]